MASIHKFLFVALQVHHYLFALQATLGASVKIDYGDALDKSLMFFEGQRSGKLPSNRRVQWRGDSALRDGSSQNVDLVGGYFDAGDNVKFGLPMAYSVTMLGWAAVDFKEQIIDANQMEYTLQAIRWGTDYFIKTHSDVNVLWAQVGDGVSDHHCWERPEDMDTPRTAYKLDTITPGSDVAAETAAALAASSLAFKHSNSSYSAVLLHHAKQLFSFADSFRCKYTDSIPNAKGFYPSSGYSDELLWAAVWLYRATTNDYYLQYAAYNGVELGGSTNGVKIFSWDNKYAGVQILMSKFFLDGEVASYTDTLKQYKEKADYFVCAYLQKNNGFDVPRTPGGLAFVLASNNLQYAASAAFLLSVYSDYLSRANAVVQCPNAQMKPQDLLTFAKSQAEYILGKNPKSMSYLVGYGEVYPMRIHHRSSSIPSISYLPSKVGCKQGYSEWFKNPGKNPNILYGALVGGPDSSDDFSDRRNNYNQNEPTTSAVAPLVGLFAKMQSVSTSSGYKTPYKATPTQPSNAIPIWGRCGVRENCCWRTRRMTSNESTGSSPEDTVDQQSTPPDASTLISSPSQPPVTPSFADEHGSPSPTPVAFELVEPVISAALAKKSFQYILMIPLVGLMSTIGLA